MQCWLNLHSVWSTLNKLLLGGLEACPQEKFKNYPAKIESESSFDGKLWSCKAHGGWLATHPRSVLVISVTILFMYHCMVCNWTVVQVSQPQPWIAIIINYNYNHDGIITHSVVLSPVIFIVKAHVARPFIWRHAPKEPFGAHLQKKHLAYARLLILSLSSWMHGDLQ